ncbi:glycosyltransferase family 2 protein [Stratiformator vulcanicus]|uniref:Putative glycosyltransferase EpsJ n=1 Tax=Stratiformator vulcanicus TaxID=2527980 RepID=A0A517QVW7_9PLAN|nr:glycosyltransferase [Stratiformator vulcanicus]QDT35768.1 putative glycosyltransferase EpsJ [Stratiformator vulcanicus]
MNATHPIVSVIIPCYRQAHLLPEAVDSVLRQTYKAVEIVVVNDGSDDNTDEVARSYGDRIKYVEKENGGLSSARNAGLAVATGDFVHFLDADDCVFSSAYADMIGSFADKVGCVQCGFRTFTNPGELGHRWQLPNRSSCLLNSTVFGWVPHGVLWTRSAINKVGFFDEKLDSCEDWDIFVRAAIAGVRVRPFRRVRVLYRTHPNSMSTNSERMVRTRIDVITKHRQFLESAIRSDRRLHSAFALVFARLRQRARKVDADQKLVEQVSLVESFLLGRNDVVRYKMISELSYKASSIRKFLGIALSDMLLQSATFKSEALRETARMKRIGYRTK